jgi:hypothetical protein
MCNGDCNQGRTCNCGKHDYGWLTTLIWAVALVYAASCIGYAWGGWR